MMSETILTIPINELFRPKCGCPVCRMEEMLEEQGVQYITGDAMMEPSVRVATNKKGFCHRHFSRMLMLGNRLPNALLLETHMEEVMANYLPKKDGGKPDKKKLEGLRDMLGSCYVCDRIASNVAHLVSLVLMEWAKGGEFRELYREQPFICLKHYQYIMTAAMARGGIPSKLLGEFHADTAALTKNYMEALYGDIKHFVSMFDYRNKGQDWGTSVDAIERSIEFLTGEKPAVPEK